VARREAMVEDTAETRMLAVTPHRCIWHTSIAALPQITSHNVEGVRHRSYLACLSTSIPTHVQKHESLVFMPCRKNMLIDAAVVALEMRLLMSIDVECA
jgi:hypothetical protein